MNNKNYNKYYKQNKQEAVALSYEKNKDIAPKIIASGKGYIADHIINLAHDHDIPIHKDEELVKILSALELNSQIPLETYSIVASILSAISEYKK